MLISFLLTELPPDVILSDLAPASRLRLQDHRKRKATAMQRVGELVMSHSSHKLCAVQERRFRQRRE